MCTFVYIYVQTYSGTDSGQTLCTAETSQQMPYEAMELPTPMVQDTHTKFSAKGAIVPQNQDKRQLLFF